MIGCRQACIYPFLGWVPQVYQTNTALYELAFTATQSVSGCCFKLSNVELGYSLNG